MISGPEATLLFQFYHIYISLNGYKGGRFYIPGLTRFKIVLYDRQKHDRDNTILICCFDQ